MQREQLLQRECYLYRDGRAIGIVTDRVFARKGRKNDPRSVAYEHVPPGIRAAKSATDRSGSWVEYGYFGVRPTTTDPEHDYATDIRNLPWDLLIDPATELPRPDQIPAGFEPFFVTQLRNVEGLYEEAVARRATRARHEAAAAERACIRHNDLAVRLSRFLPKENPVPTVEQRKYAPPEGVTMTFAQAERLARRLEGIER